MDERSAVRTPVGVRVSQVSVLLLIFAQWIHVEMAYELANTICAAEVQGVKIVSQLEVKRRSEEFICKEPQNRSYPTKVLLNGLKNLSHYQKEAPKFITLKRCDSFTGCCINSNQRCTASNSSMELLEVTAKKMGKIVTIRLKVVQHTKCHCTETKELPYISEDIKNIEARVCGIEKKNT